jgi:hypothetical protein
MGSIRSLGRVTPESAPLRRRCWLVSALSTTEDIVEWE